MFALALVGVAVNAVNFFVLGHHGHSHGGEGGCDHGHGDDGHSHADHGPGEHSHEGGHSHDHPGAFGQKTFSWKEIELPSSESLKLKS
jgi:Co/Zn/Cd efflux system component